jgi:Zn-dependent metalloprotease
MLACFTAQEVSAQIPDATKIRVDRAVHEVENIAGEPLDVNRSPVTGLATFLKTRSGRPIPILHASTLSAESRSLRFLIDHGDAFAIADEEDLRVVKTSEIDIAGMQHVRLQQFHQGVPITGGELIVHFRGTSVSSVSTRTLPNLDDLDTSPTITSEQALDSVRLLLEQRMGLADVQYGLPRLEIFNRGLLENIPYPTRLAWFIEARHVDHREFVWVDALQGEVLLHFNQLSQALDRSIYSAKHTNFFREP